MVTKMDNASAKLKALCEGLEIRHIDLLMDNANIEDFQMLGEKIAKRTKVISFIGINYAEEWKELKRELKKERELKNENIYSKGS